MIRVNKFNDNQISPPPSGWSDEEWMPILLYLSDLHKMSLSNIDLALFSGHQTSFLFNAMIELDKISKDKLTEENYLRGERLAIQFEDQTAMTYDQYRRIRLYEIKDRARHKIFPDPIDRQV